MIIQCSLNMRYGQLTRREWQGQRRRNAYARKLRRKDSNNRSQNKKKLKIRALRQVNNIQTILKTKKKERLKSSLRIILLPYPQQMKNQSSRAEKILCNSRYQSTRSSKLRSSKSKKKSLAPMIQTCNPRKKMKIKHTLRSKKRKKWTK